MQANGFPGAFASAAKIGSRCRWKDADDPVVADRQDKLGRWHDARRNGLSAEDAARAVGVSRATLFRWDRRRRDGRLKLDMPDPVCRTIGTLLAWDFLILDELGCLPFAPGCGQLLFHPVRKLCERTSILAAANLAFGEWPSVFGDARMTAVLLDLPAHLCEIIETGNESCRFRNRSQTDRRAGRSVKRRLSSSPRTAGRGRQETRTGRMRE